MNAIILDGKKKKNILLKVKIDTIWILYLSRMVSEIQIVCVNKIITKLSKADKLKTVLQKPLGV